MKNLLGLILILLLSCQETAREFDASGAFEAVEIVISSEATGVLHSFAVREGEELMVGDAVGQVDTTQLFLRKKQLLAQIQAIGSHTPNVEAQTSFFDEQYSEYCCRISFRF